MEIPFEIEGKTIKYTDIKGVERKGFVVSVYNACDGPGDEAGMLFSGEYENLDVPESEIASIEVIE